MDVNSIIASIPNVIGSLYEVIYVVNKETDLCYTVHYTGDKLKISAPHKYADFITFINSFKDSSISDIETNKEYKKVLVTKKNKEKLVSVVTREKFKLVFVMDISFVYEVNEDKKILIIADDSAVITKFFVKILKDEYQVLVAKNGNEAIELINENMDKPVVGFFCDLKMPEKDGYEVLDYFKENDLFKKIPVSVISGEETKEGIEKVTTYDIVDMLTKPFSEAAVRDVVNKTIAFSPKNN